jgi:pyoverdine/dityrosine biosynthesis protein Dit1
MLLSVAPKELFKKRGQSFLMYNYTVIDVNRKARCRRCLVDIPLQFILGLDVLVSRERYFFKSGLTLAVLLTCAYPAKKTNG